MHPEIGKNPLLVRKRFEICKNDVFYSYDQELINQSTNQSQVCAKILWSSADMFSMLRGITNLDSDKCSVLGVEKDIGSTVFETKREKTTEKTTFEV